MLRPYIHTTRYGHPARYAAALTLRTIYTRPILSLPFAPVGDN